MTAKEYMKQAKILLRRIDRKQKEADALRQKLSVPQSPDFSDMPKAVSPTPNEIETGVAKIISVEFKAWKVIFSEMGYSKSSAYRLHQEALSIIKFGTSWDYVGLDESSNM